MLNKINKMKFGVIDHDYINEIVDAVNSFNSLRQKLELMAGKMSPNKQPPQIIARLNSIESFATITIERFNGEESTLPVIWRYGFVMQKLVSVSMGEVIGQERNGSVEFADTDSAYSTHEIQNLYKKPDDAELPEVGYAFNLGEVNAPDIYDDTGRVFGVDVKSETYPEGFEPQSIIVPSIVILKKMTDGDGNIWFAFDRRNTHDGTCT